MLSAILLLWPLTFAFSQEIKPATILNDSLVCFNADAIKAFRKMKERKTYLERLTTDQQLLIGNWERAFAEQGEQLLFARTQIDHFRSLEAKSQTILTDSRQEIETWHNAYSKQRKQNRLLKYGTGGAMILITLNFLLP